MKLMLSRQRTWFAVAVGFAAIVALPSAARPSDVVTPRAVAAEGAAPTSTDPDAVIIADIKAQFAQERDLRRVLVGISSANGHVTLAGSAPSSIARDRAIQIAKDTPGVFRVDSYIRLDISSPEAPAPP